MQQCFPTFFLIIMEHMKTHILRTNCLKMTVKIAHSQERMTEGGKTPNLTTQGPMESASWQTRNPFAPHPLTQIPPDTPGQNLGIIGRLTACGVWDSFKARIPEMWH